MIYGHLIICVLELHDLEQKHSIEDGVVVIGVHSAKFQNEKLLENVQQAVMRYDICHPVVNDADAALWNDMSIRCWPTFVIVSPEGHPLLYLVGEGHRDVLFNFVQLALDYYNQKGMDTEFLSVMYLLMKYVLYDESYFAWKVWWDK